MRTEIITSAQNPKIKNLLLLQEKSKARREQGLFVVEGRRELEHCREAGLSIRTLFVCREIFGDIDSAENYFLCRCPKNQFPAESQSVLRHPTHSEAPSIIEIPEALYRKVAYRESTEGIIAEVEYKSLKLEELQLPENPLVMVLESVEKPGNLGAVLRSADAAGVDAVIFCDPLTDLYNPNLIRASIGAVFTVPTVLASSQEAIAFLQERGIQILTAQLQDRHAPRDGAGDGHRGHRPYRPLAQGGIGPYPYSHAGQAGQSKCVRIGRHPPFRSRSSAAVGCPSGKKFPALQKRGIFCKIVCLTN